MRRPVIAGQLSPSLVRDSGHLLFGHAVHCHHMLAQVIHSAKSLAAMWTLRFAAVHLHMLPQADALGISCSTYLARNMAVWKEKNMFRSVKQR